jgi:hypothetical protein
LEHKKNKMESRIDLQRAGWNWSHQFHGGNPMRLVTFFAAGLFTLLASASPALAAVACPSGSVCASRPGEVAGALGEIGYKANLRKSEIDGDPVIDSAASGYKYTIYFYGCENNLNCTSLQLRVSFAQDGGNSAALANEWNVKKRFSTMSFDPKDGALAISYDVTTVGGLSNANFADVIDWWQTMMGEANKFFKEHPAPK